MAKQIIYTSVPRGLIAGQTGYTIAARHRDLRERVVETIQRASAYSFAGRPDAPAIFAHRIYRYGTAVYHVLSRVVDAGADYTGRTNYLAHHLVCDQEELAGIQATPADVLSAFPWLDRFSGESRYLGDDEQVFMRDFGVRYPLPAVHWAKLRGQSADAALLIGEGGKGRDALCLVGDAQASEKLLPLFAESLRAAHLVGGSSASWNIPFVTLVQESDEIASFSWIGASPESTAARRSGARIRLQIPVLNLPVPSGEVATVAVSGQAPTRAIAVTPEVVSEIEVVSPVYEAAAAEPSGQLRSGAERTVATVSVQQAFRRPAESTPKTPVSIFVLVAGVMILLGLAGLGIFGAVTLLKKRDAQTKAEQSFSQIDNEAKGFLKSGENPDGKSFAELLELYRDGKQIEKKLADQEKEQLREDSKKSLSDYNEQTTEALKRIEDRLLELKLPRDAREQIQIHIEQGPFRSKLLAKVDEPEPVIENPPPPKVEPSPKATEPVRPDKILIAKSIKESGSSQRKSWELDVLGEVPWSKGNPRSVKLRMAQEPFDMANWQKQKWGASHEFLYQGAEADKTEFGSQSSDGSKDFFLKELRDRFHVTCNLEIVKDRVIQIEGASTIWILPLSEATKWKPKLGGVERHGDRISPSSSVLEFLKLVDHQGWKVMLSWRFDEVMSDIITSGESASFSWRIAPEKVKNLENSLQRENGYVDRRKQHENWTAASIDLDRTLNTYVKENSSTRSPKFKEWHQNLIAALNERNQGKALQAFGELLSACVIKNQVDKVKAKDAKDKAEAIDTEFSNYCRHPPESVAGLWGKLQGVSVNLNNLLNEDGPPPVEGKPAPTTPTQGAKGLLFLDAERKELEALASLIDDLVKAEKLFVDAKLFEGRPESPPATMWGAPQVERYTKILGILKDQSRIPPGTYSIEFQSAQEATTHRPSPGNVAFSSNPGTPATVLTIEITVPPQP